MGTLLGYAIPARAVATPPRLGLGYSATSVVPVSAGLPVYTKGDQLWVESFYSYPVVAMLLAANQTIVAPPRYLYPESTGLLYVFGSSDPLGSWKLQLLGSDSASVVFQLVGADGVNASVTGLSLSGNTATYAISVTGNGTYSDQACLLGVANPTVTIGLPPLLSSGSLRVQWHGSSLSVTRNGTVFNSFAYSFELFQPYSYELPGSSGLDTVQLEVGFSVPVVVTQVNASAQVVPMTWLASPREGEFDLRAVITSQSGSQTTDVPVLFAGGGMVSLSLCTPLVHLTSNAFMLSADLDLPSSRWPRQLVLLSSANGVEGYSLYQIPWEVARAEVLGGPSGSPLTSATLTAGSAPTGDSLSVFGNEIFFAGPEGSFVGSVHVTLSQLGRTSALNVSFSSPYTAEVLQVPAGELSVSAVSGGALLGNASVTVASPGGSLTRTSGSHPVVFELLPGSYNLSATQGVQTSLANAMVVAGNSTQVVMDLTPQGEGSAFIVLLAAALAGVGANVVVWLVLPKRVF
jgi:hypothetical protein